MSPNLTIDIEERDTTGGLASDSRKISKYYFIKMR